MRRRRACRRGPPTSRSPASPTTAAPSAPGTLFFCVPGFTRRRPRLRARRRSSAAPPRSSSSGRSASACPRSVVDDVRAAMAPAAAALLRRPDRASCDVVGVTGTNGKTTTAFLVRALLEAAGHPDAACSARSSRSSAGDERQVERTTPEAIDLQRDFRAMLDGGDGPARWRSPRTRSSCDRADAIHFAAAIFTNLTQDHLDFHADDGGLLPAKRRLFDGRAAAPRSSTSTTRYGAPAGRRAADGAVTFAVERDGRLPRRATSSCGLERLALHRAHARRRASSCARRCPGRFNVANALGALAAARALGVPSSTRPSTRWPSAGARARPLRAGRRGPGLRRARRLRPHARLARERAARRARARRERPACIVRLRRRRRPRPRQAAADGRDRRARSPTSSSSPPTTRAPRTPRRSSPRSSQGTGGGPGVEARSTAAPRSRARSRWPRPGDVVVIAGKGHEQGQEFAGGRKVPFDDVTVAREALARGGRRARVIELDARASRRGGRRAARSPATPARRARPRAVDRLARGRRRATCSSASPASATTAAASPPQALEAGAWGVLVTPEHAAAAPPRGAGARARRRRPARRAPAASPRAWRDELGARRSSAITGSTGKTSTKDILAALLRAAPSRTLRQPARTSTPRSGCRSTCSSAEPGPRCWCSRWRCAAPGQIAELAAIAEPDVGVIVNVGPVHLELLGTLEAIAAAKAELIARPARRAATAVVPAGEPLLAPHLRDDVRTRHVRRRRRRARCVGGRTGDARERSTRAATRLELELPFTQAHNRAQPARRGGRARVALGVAARRAASRCAFSPLRGERVELADGVRRRSTTATTPTRCRCAPPSTTSPDAARRRAASRCSATCSSSAPTSARFHEEIGRHAAARGVDVLVTVGPLAAAMADALRRRGLRRRPTPPRPRRSCPRAARSPATSCWSRARAASASRSSPRRCASASEA